MAEGGGVGLLPALCRLRMACVLFTLLTESRLLPSSGATWAKSNRQKENKLNINYSRNQLK